VPRPVSATDNIDSVVASSLPYEGMASAKVETIDASSSTSEVLEERPLFNFWKVYFVALSLVLSCFVWLFFAF